MSLPLQVPVGQCVCQPLQSNTSVHVVDSASFFDNRKHSYFDATYCTSRAPRYRSSVPTQTSRGLQEYLKKTWYERVHASRTKRVSGWAHASHTAPVPAAPPAPSARHHALSPCLTPLPYLVDLARVGFSRHHRHFRDAQPAPALTSALHRHRR